MPFMYRYRSFLKHRTQVGDSKVNLLGHVLDFEFSLLAAAFPEETQGNAQGALNLHWK